MMFLPKIFAGKDEPADNVPPAFQSNAGPAEKTGVVSNVDSDSREHTDDDEHQKGIEEVEATVKVWSPFHIYLAWGL